MPYLRAFPDLANFVMGGNKIYPPKINYKETQNVSTQS